MKYHHGNLKEKLIQSAYDWISENGIEGISLRKIAKISNVSQTAPYRHFSSKEHLLADVTKLGFKNFSFQKFNLFHRVLDNNKITISKF